MSVKKMTAKILTFCVVFYLTSLVLGQYNDLPKIYSLHISSEIQFRFATTLVTSRVANPSNYSQDVTFEVTLPEEAFISNFTLEIDGEIYPATVKDKEQARKDYEKEKKKGKTTGLVSQNPRDSKSFKVEITVAAESELTFNLTYQELLKRVTGVYEHRIFVSPGYPVEDLKISVSIRESRDITKLHVPPLRNLKGLLSNDIEDDLDNTLAVIDRPSSKRALVRYSPKPKEQGLNGVSGQFIVQYDVDRSLDGGDVLVVNGYFVHFLAPEVENAIPNDVVFVLDVSGSMTGRKIEQLKTAMYSILDELKEGDRFNIILFHDLAKLYKEELIHVTARTIADAKTFVRRIKSKGWTNINGAVETAIQELKRREKDEGAPIIVFLTDGQATSGETNNKQILRNVIARNEGRFPVFSLAFGTDADWYLVKKMAIQNNGIGRKIYEDSDADLQISGFYDQIAVTLLNDVSVKYLGDGVDDVTNSYFKSYFAGSEMVVAGRLSDSGVPTVDLEILSTSSGGALVLTGDSDTNIIDLSESMDSSELMDFQSITEKTWAYLTIKQLLERAASEEDPDAVEKMKERAKELSLKYGFVTPLTSMVVVKPELDEETKANTRPPIKPPTTMKPPSRQRYKGHGGGRGYSGGGGGDPHFMIRIAGIEHPLCFDFPSKAGDIVNLITDPRKHITVNTEIIGGDMGLHGEKTFMGKVAIQTSHHVIMITPEVIVFDDRILTWDEEKAVHFGGHKFMLSDKGKLLKVQLDFGPEILIRRHVHATGHRAALNYLNFYVNKEDGFSSQTTGLIGQFVNGQKHIIVRKTFVSDAGKHVAKMQVKEGAKFILSDNENTNATTKHGSTSHRIAADLVPRTEIIEKGTEMCWLFHKRFEETLYGKKAALLRKALITM